MQLDQCMMIGCLSRKSTLDVLIGLQLRRAFQVRNGVEFCQNAVFGTPDLFRSAASSSETSGTMVEECGLDVTGKLS